MKPRYLLTVEVGRLYFAHCTNPTRAAHKALLRHGVPSRAHGTRQLAWDARAVSAVFANYERAAA